MEKYADQQGNGRVVYLGKLSPEQLAGVDSLCDIGLCAYSQNSNVEMPDKIYDYTAAGLAVLNSLQGEISRVVHEHQVGRQYEAGNADDLASQLLQLETDRTQLSLYRKRSHELGDFFDHAAQLRKVNNLVERVFR